MADFADLPDIPAFAELKSRPQWVAWKYEYRNGPDEKPTKPPISPRTGFKASHSDPRTWASYDEAVARVQRSRLAGVGYVLSDDDDVTGADLDGCRDVATGRIEPWAKEIVDLAETYAEVSPSGTGLRFIWRGKIDKTVKCDPASVEIYRSKRFLTITGQHIEGTPEAIQEAPRTLEALLHRVEEYRPKEPTLNGSVYTQSPVSGTVAVYDGFGSEGTDFFKAVNSASLANLAAWVPTVFGSGARYQPGTGAYRVSSRFLDRKLQEDLSLAPTGIVDFGVHDMGDRRQGKRSPIDVVIEFGGAPDVLAAALWLCDRLGRAPADLGWREDDGHGAELAAALVESVSPAKDEPLPLSTELPDHLTRLPGLLGELTDWIVASSRRPQAGLALGAALTVIGTAAGRHIAGPTGSGTHLYVIGLAPTGAGKDHPLQQIGVLLAASGMRHHIGPSQFISMPAVINFLVRSPLSVCAMDEFGSFMKRINSRRASGFESAIAGILRTAWGTSFKSMATPEWAGRASETIFAPALSIYGVSTAEEFYGALEGADTANGVLNRLLIIETRERPADREPTVDPFTVPPEIVTGIKRVYERAGTLISSQLNRSDCRPDMHLMAWGRGAHDAYRSLVEDILQRCEGNGDAHAFMARTAENALRAASIRAIGTNPIFPMVSVDDMEWGARLALWSAKAMTQGATDHIADSENQQSANMVRRAIRASGGRMKHRDLLRKLNHKIRDRDLKDIIRALVEAEQIGFKDEPHPVGGLSTRWYFIAAS